MLKIGDKIPNVDLITHKGEKINLNDLKGKKIVIFFSLATPFNSYHSQVAINIQILP